MVISIMCVSCFNRRVPSVIEEEEKVEKNHLILMTHRFLFKGMFQPTTDVRKDFFVKKHETITLLIIPQFVLSFISLSLFL